MRPTRTAALLAIVVLAAVPACTSDDKPSPPSSSSSSAAGEETTAAQLASAMYAATDGVRSEMLRLNATLLGSKISGVGPAHFAQGELDATDLKGEIEGSGRLRLVLLNGQGYAQAPAFTKTGKPWLLVNAKSKKVIAAQLGQALDGIKAATSLNRLVTLVQAAHTFERKGTAKIGGRDTVHYSFTVDAAKLPASFPARKDYAGPLKGSRIELWVDARSRAVKTDRTVVVSGQKVPVTLTASDFGTDVTVSAPPQSDVAAG